MPEFAKELLTIDLRRLDLRAGVLGVAVLSVFGVAIAQVGTPAMAAVIGALVVLSADPPAKGRSTAARRCYLLWSGARS